MSGTYHMLSRREDCGVAEKAFLYHHQSSESSRNVPTTPISSHHKTSQHSSSTTSMLLLQPQVSLPGFTELPGFLDALVDAESVLHNSDSESEFMSVGGTCGNFYEDYSNIHHQHQGISSGASNGFLGYNIPTNNSFGIHNHHQAQFFMEENSNSSSNNEHENETASSGGLGQSPSCYLIESPSLQGSVSLDTTPEPGTPLPSFQETYSPRYRRDVFSFDESAVSPSFPTTTASSTAGGPAPVGPSISAPATPHSSCQQPPQPGHTRRHPFQHQHSLDSPSSSTTASPQTPLSYHQMYYPSQSPTSYELMHSPPPQLIPLTQQSQISSQQHVPQKQRKSSGSCHMVKQMKIESASSDKQPCSPALSLAGSHESMDIQSGSGSSVMSPPTDKACAVCGDTAACQHYGVRTCEGCKGFFKRTVQRGAKYVCMANRNCPVDKRRRNRCQFCRFQKCLSVGMVREVVRTDSLKGRRGRLPSKPRAERHGGEMSGHCHTANTAPSPPVSLITALVRAHLDTSPSPDTQNKDYSMYLEPPFHEGDLPQDKDSVVNHPEYIQQFFGLLSSCFDVIRAFAEKIPGFLEFSKHDQELLLQSASLELFVLRLAYRVQPNEDNLTFCNGIVLHREQCKPIFGDWYEAIMEFSQTLQAMQLDLSAMACLEALVLVTDRHSLEDVVKVEQLQMKIIGSLRDHVTYTGEGQSKPHFFSRILGKLPELRSLSVQGLQRIFYLKLEDLIPAPPAIEAMFSSTLPF